MRLMRLRGLIRLMGLMRLKSILLEAEFQILKYLTGIRAEH
jgi:hypothetical protein